MSALLGMLAKYEKLEADRDEWQRLAEARKAAQVTLNERIKELEAAADKDLSRAMQADLFEARIAGLAASQLAQDRQLQKLNDFVTAWEAGTLREIDDAYEALGEGDE